MTMAKAKIASDTLRKQLANMIYVGVVAGVLGIPCEQFVDFATSPPL